LAKAVYALARIRKSFCYDGSQPVSQGYKSPQRRVGSSPTLVIL
jgi:hypothetical protein